MKSNISPYQPTAINKEIAELERGIANLNLRQNLKPSSKADIKSQTVSTDSVLPDDFEFFEEYEPEKEAGAVRPEVSAQKPPQPPPPVVGVVVERNVTSKTEAQPKTKGINDDFDEDDENDEEINYGGTDITNFCLGSLNKPLPSFLQPHPLQDTALVGRSMKWLWLINGIDKQKGNVYNSCMKRTRGELVDVQQVDSVCVCVCVWQEVEITVVTKLSHFS